MVRHPLLTTLEEFNRDRDYYKIFSERLIIFIKIILIYLYCRNLYRIWMKGWGGWMRLNDKDYYKIYLEKINYIYKNNFDLFIL